MSIATLINFDSLLLLSQLPAKPFIATIMSTEMRTRSVAVKKPKEDLIYLIKDTLLQMKSEAQKVCAVNARMETMVKLFMGYLDITQAGLLSSYVYALFTILTCTGCGK